MKRRDFLRSVGVASAALALPTAGRLFADDAAPAISNGWRTFEVTTRVEVLNPSGETRVWLPAALMTTTPYQRTVGNKFEAEGGKARLVETSKADALGIVAATFPAGVKPVLTLTSQVQTKNIAVSLSEPARPKEDHVQLVHCLQPTKLLPTDGIVKETALAITKGASTDVDKARAIYEWIVENTFRNAATRGCGVGDIRFMLESKDLGGKCADLNALYVGLARSAGIPARDVYGIRVAKSELGYKSLARRRKPSAARSIAGPKSS